MRKKIFVINLKGEKEQFSFKKVFHSARRCGASKELAFEIASQIEKEAFPGISTSQIFNRVFELLLKKSPQSAIRFNLRQALEKLGPSGFPFEKFVARVFEAEGFKVKLNQIIPGYCTEYEIDIVAQKENSVYIIECKYHHIPGARVDLNVALANYARFLDIQKGRFFNSQVSYKSYLVTNAKFTEKAIKYSECAGVYLLGWKYPKDRGLEFLIEKNKLYPITILPSVTKNITQTLIERGIVLVKDVLSENFEKIKIPKKEKIKEEAKMLIKK